MRPAKDAFCKPRKRKLIPFSKKIKKKDVSTFKVNPAKLMDSFVQVNYSAGLQSLLRNSSDFSVKEESSGLTSKEADSFKKVDLQIIVQNEESVCKQEDGDTVKSEHQATHDWSLRGSHRACSDRPPKTDANQPSRGLFQVGSEVKMEDAGVFKVEHSLGEISKRRGQAQRDQSSRREAVSQNEPVYGASKCGIDWSRVKQIGVKNIRSMIKQNRFSNFSDAPSRSSEIKNEQTSLSWILKQKENHRDVLKPTFKYGEIKKDLSPTSKKKIAAIMKYIQKNVLKADYYLRKYNRIKEKLSLRGTLMNKGGSTNCSFLSLLLMTESDHPFEIGRLNLEKIIKHNWIKQKNKLEGTFNQDSLKKSKYMMYEDYIILKIMDMPGKRRTKVRLLSEYLQRTQLSITDHLKILNRAMRESDIRTWFFPLVENHLGQYSEWIRINYKSLLPDPFQRNDGGVIRFSFHVDWWILFDKIKNGDGTFEENPEVHLRTICLKLYNKEVDCSETIHKMQDYFNLILKFEHFLKILRNARHEKIYLDGKTPNGVSIYSYEELYPLLTPDNHSQSVREHPRPEPHAEALQQPVLESKEVVEEFNLKPKLDRAMRIKKHNRKGIHVLVFEFSDRILTNERLINSSLKLNAQEKMFLCWLVAYSLGRMTEEYRQHLRELLCKPVENTEVFLARIQSILVILDKIKGELSMRDQQIRIEDICSKIKKIRSIFSSKLSNMPLTFDIVADEYAIH